MTVAAFLNQQKKMIMSKNRNRPNFAVVLVLCFSMQLSGVAYAQSTTPCGYVAGQGNAAKTAAKDKVNQDVDYDTQALKNAMTCLQRVKDLLALLTLPGLPDLMSMSEVIDFMSNKACQVAMKEVQKTVVDPVTGKINEISKDIYDSVGDINKGTGGLNPIKNGSSTTVGGVTKSVTEAGKASNSAVALPQQIQVSPSSSSSSSVWNRVGCAFGSGC